LNNHDVNAVPKSSVSVLIVTGQSGSGKSVALAALEDAGFYCIDNLPPELLANLLETYQQGHIKAPSIAIGIDARSSEAALAELPERITELKRLYPELKIQSLYLEASIPRIVARFSETRRRHPLSNRHENLLQAIEQEADMLAAMRQQADLLIDTSNTTVHQIREDLHQRLLGAGTRGPVILLQSFGFKNGIPLDSDFVFDIRHLPNPHWLPDLRGFNGQSEVIAHYLEAHPITVQTRTHLHDFIQSTLTELVKTDRSYVTCSIGCTGGKHRSVYMVEHLFLDLKPIFSELLIRHRDLTPAA